MLLDTINRSLKFLLDGGLATVHAVAHYEDTDVQGRVFPAANAVVSNNTTAVIAVAAPKANMARRIKELSLANTDASTHIATVNLVDNSTVYQIAKMSIPAGQTLYYNSEFGWSLVT